MKIIIFAKNNAIMKKILFVAALALVAAGLVSCGGNTDRTATITQNSLLTQALASHDMDRAGVLADSMALIVDDLTPDETVTVLLTFLEIHNRDAASRDADADLVTLRKYVDVYELAMNTDAAGMREAFGRAKGLNPKVDFEKSYDEFRRALAEYDAVQSYGDEPVEEAAPAKTDSVKTDDEKEIKSETATDVEAAAFD